MKPRQPLREQNGANSCRYISWEMMGACSGVCPSYKAPFLAEGAFFVFGAGVGMGEVKGF